uniref:HTH myb-type domain-containing protein n=1 Tax=Chenopodium quinoa TaxID=63459 RepID=A0A803LNV5_CHEQI
MGLVCPELSLDLKPSYVSETINGFLSEVSMIGDVSERLNKVDGFVTQLEAELNKIEVFKRELPLCMLLLKEVLEEFIPLKKESENTELNKTSEDDSGKDKKNWMSSVQLWNSPHLIRNSNSNQAQNHVSESPKEDVKQNQNLGSEIHDLSKIRGGSKGFVPLNHNNNYPTSNFPELTRKVDKEDVSVSGLTLVVPGMINHLEDDSISRVFNPKLGSTRVSNSSPPASIGRPSHQQPSARKQRRCWSPELHRRFVDALTQLGGPQVATPKQIRELMRVDGLTNDEVKSHLQKYRLHSRQVPSDSGNKNGQALSGSWTAQDQYSESSKPSSSQSASPEGPLQFPGLTGCTSTTGGDSMDDEDDDKSESHSWKGHAHKTGKDDV